MQSIHKVAASSSAQEWRNLEKRESEVNTLATDFLQQQLLIEEEARELLRS